MGRGARFGLVLVLFIGAVGLAVYTVKAYLLKEPPTLNYVSGHQAGQPLNLTIQTVGSIGTGPHPTWVSYLAQAPDGKWVHTTLWELPANTKVNVTIYQYDSGSPLRNQQLGLPVGVQSPTLNGKPLKVIDSNATKGLDSNGVGHTFSVPTLGINVPLLGISGSAKNACSVAPCLPGSSDHNVVKFSFTTPAHSGEYRWQCFVPCGLATVDGNGGPMQTVGYMGGFLKVVA